MLAERGMYLSTRIPLMSGYFADVWLSQLAANPNVRVLLDDAHALVGASERLTTVAEQLPVQLAEERNEAISQLFDGIAVEREKTIEQFAAEEQRLSGVLTELRQTLAAGNELVLAVGDLVETLDTGPPDESTTQAPPVPFDIVDYRHTLVEAGETIRDLNSLLGSTQELLDSHGASELLPQLATAIDEVGAQGRSVSDHLFLRVFLLIVVALVGYVIARLVHEWLALRLVRRSQ
jgi:hypothetical protein